MKKELIIVLLINKDANQNNIELPFLDCQLVKDFKNKDYWVLVERGCIEIGTLILLVGV